jgi:hypothetical protein
MRAKRATPIDAQILVFGTLAFETALIPKEPSDRATYHKHRGWVGADFIRKMIHEALDSGGGQKGQSFPVKIHPTGLRFDEAKFAELTTIFGQFPRKSGGKKSDAVWRVKQNCRADKVTDYTEYVKQCVEACPAPDVVVIYEQDPHFRKALAGLARESRNRKSGAGGRLSAPALIVALADDVDKTSIEAARELFGPGSTTIALVHADGLRHSGLNIVDRGSIEQTVHELSDCLSLNPLKGLMDHCSHLIVLFEETSAMCISNAKPRKGSIHFCPNFDRVAQMDRDIYGHVPGRMAIALTSVTRAICQWRTTSNREPLDLDRSLRLAVLAYNVMFDKGLGNEDPFRTVETALSLEEPKKLQGHLNPSDPRRDFLVSSVTFPANSTLLNRWSRLTESDPDIAVAIVLKGIEAACRNYNADTGAASGVWWPASQITCPFMQIGRFQTFDRDEIERFADLWKLMRKYHDDASWSTPLSIAVFGPPGAGKSFAVKQLMRSVNPGIKESSILTFNLAQFNSLEFLTEAFHQVQDQSLSSDDVPLVIFDEFDSNFQGSALGWLKYFLAPMEDGVFRGRTGDYKVGRAVFLFAGGTADSFETFTQGPAKPTLKSTAGRVNDQEMEKKAVKLPDFASRLMTHLDVLGINRPPNESKTESSLIIRRRMRRATLLRSLLAEFADPIIAPDGKANVVEEVVRAFLDDDVTYRNQARSMKALVRGARWISRWFLVASLPSRRVIELHTENWPFKNLS